MQTAGSVEEAARKVRRVERREQREREKDQRARVKAEKERVAAEERAGKVLVMVSQMTQVLGENWKATDTSYAAKASAAQEEGLARSRGLLERERRAYEVQRRHATQSEGCRETCFEIRVTGNWKIASIVGLVGTTLTEK